MSYSSINLEIREIREILENLNFIGALHLFFATIFSKKPVESYFEFLMSFIKENFVTFHNKNLIKV